jgi:RNA polymerase sigma-70 factor (ECF subfamily)
VDILRKAGRHPTISLDHRGAGQDTEPSALVDLLVSQSEGPFANLQEAERRDWVRKAIDRLPDTLKKTLLLAYFQDLKYREIAEVLNIPVGTVKSRLHAALNKLIEMAGAARINERE